MNISLALKPKFGKNCQKIYEPAGDTSVKIFTLVIYDMA